MSRTKGMARKAHAAKRLQRTKKRLVKNLEWKVFFTKLNKAPDTEPRVDIIQQLQHLSATYRHILSTTPPQHKNPPSSQ